MNNLGVKKNDIVIPKDIIWILALTLFFAVCLNYDWRQSRLVWYGSIAVLVVAYVIAYSGRFKLENFGFLTWYLSFLALCFLSLFWCLSVSVGMTVIKTLLVFLVVFFLLQFSVNNGFSLDKIIICFFVAMLINMLYVITNIDLAKLGETQIGDNLIEGWNGNGIGFMATEGALAGFYLIDKFKNRFSIIFLLLATVFFCFVTMYTGSRTAFIMLVAGILLYLYIKKPTKIVRNIILTFLLLYVLYCLMMNVEGIYNVLGTRLKGLLALFSGEGTADTSSLHRDEFIQNGIKWFGESPIVGYGVNNYKVLNKDAMGKFTYAHNTFIEIAVDFGVVGLIWYYSVYVFLAWRLFKNSKNNRLNSFLLASLLSSLISQYGTVSYYAIYHNLLLFMCFVAINISKKERSNQDI